MVEGAQTGEFVRRPGNLERVFCVCERFARARRQGDGVCRGRGHDDVVSTVDGHVWHAQLVKRTAHHLGVFVAVEVGRRADDGVVHVSLVVEDGAASAAAADEVDGIPAAVQRLQEREVDFKPRVLVAAYDDARAVGVKEEHVGVGWGLALQGSCR